METASKQPGTWAKNRGLLGLGLCAICCTLPIMTIVGGTVFVGVISSYAEKIALILLILSSGILAFWLYKRKQATPSCPVDCTCKTENAESKTIMEINAT